MNKEKLSKRWEEFDTDKLVDAAINGNGDKDLIAEANNLMKETQDARESE